MGGLNAFGPLSRHASFQKFRARNASSHALFSGNLLSLDITCACRLGLVLWYVHYGYIRDLTTSLCASARQSDFYESEPN